MRAPNAPGRSSTKSALKVHAAVVGIQVYQLPERAGSGPPHWRYRILTAK
jgi:hypothetical protein